MQFNIINPFTIVQIATTMPFFSATQNCLRAANHGAATVKAPERSRIVPSLDKVAVDISVVLGTTEMPIHQVLRLGRGAIIELEARENDPVKILANNYPVARGTVVVSGNRIAVEVKELLPRSAEVR